MRRAMTILVVVQAGPESEVQAYPESELQGYPKSNPAALDSLTKSGIRQIGNIILASLESESLDSSTWENIATHAQKAINSICTIVFPPIVFPLIMFPLIVFYRKSLLPRHCHYLMLTTLTTLNGNDSHKVTILPRNCFVISSRPTPDCLCHKCILASLSQIVMHVGD
jgi:hypothetical protein